MGIETKDITEQIKRNAERIDKLRESMQEGDKRLGSEDRISCPRGRARQMKELQKRMRELFTSKWRLLPRRLWFWPAPGGWLSHRGVLPLANPVLRAAWRRRRAQVCADVEALHKGIGNQRNDLGHYALLRSRLPARIEQARRMRTDVQTAEPASGSPAERSPFMRTVERLRGRRPGGRHVVDVSPSVPASGSGIVSPEHRDRAVTLHDLLNEDVGKPIEREWVHKIFADLAGGFEGMRRHLEDVEKGL